MKNVKINLKSTFWKENQKPLPGRPSPSLNYFSKSQEHDFNFTSFHKFQERVSDAWDTKEDELYQLSNMKDFNQVFISRSNGSSVKNDGDQISISAKKCMQQDCSTFQISKQTCQTKYVNNKAKNESMFCKVSKLKTILESSLLNLDDLRHISWSGVPNQQRPLVWKLLAGYLSTSADRRQVLLTRKRIEYCNLVKQYFNVERDKIQEDIYCQICIDIPRMSPLISIFKQKIVQNIFERILFIWAVRHPATGYVQGMNDLVTPFFVVFLEEFLPSNVDIDSFEVHLVSKENLDKVEADTFWCFSMFLDGIQDNYIFAQLGIQIKVNQLQSLIQRVDRDLHKHLKKHDINYLQFSFRWMNNLLTREIPLDCCIRLWDTYLAEMYNFAAFQLYVSAAFLLNWRHKLLLEQDFQGLIVLLQNLPTQKWTDSDVGVLVAEAYKLKFMFADAPNHLQNN